MRLTKEQEANAKILAFYIDNDILSDALDHANETIEGSGYDNAAFEVAQVIYKAIQLNDENNEDN